MSQHSGPALVMLCRERVACVVYARIAFPGTVRRQVDASERGSAQCVCDPRPSPHSAFPHFPHFFFLS